MNAQLEVTNSNFFTRDALTMLSIYISTELQTAIFLSRLKLLEINLAGEENINYIKYEIATSCIDTKFHLNAFFFSHSTGITEYFHDISMIYS